MTTRVKLLLTALLLPALLVSGCYHLRVNPEPLHRAEFTVSLPPDRAFDMIADILVHDGYTFEQHEERDNTLVTEFRYFHKDTGIGQPAGGRDYFCKFRVTAVPAGDGATVTLEVAALEMRASYVFDNEGALRTFSKRYPYEQYPGMFDLDAVERELHRVEALVRRSLP